MNRGLENTGVSFICSLAWSGLTANSRWPGGFLLDWNLLLPSCIDVERGLHRVAQRVVIGSCILIGRGGVDGNNNWRFS
ncbi:hypothetical protein VTL71DRAFT_15396 [Oculimacula yallundae]|uniref:Uncharacterized protein n=1 Tax=Oculimacula yallundae TaxID=86028 RepID=A0ABR4CGK5_9HELO